MRHLAFPTGSLKGEKALKTAFGCTLFVACAAVLCMAGLSLVQSHRQYQRRTEIEAQNLCAALADSLTATFDKIDQALLTVKDEAEHELAQGAIDGQRLERLIDLQRRRIHGSSSLRVTDPAGFIAYGGDPARRICVADRNYFQVLRADPRAGLVSTKALQGRLDPGTVIILARRMDRPDGTFGGLVFSGVFLEELSDHFATYSIGQEGILSLRDRDNAVLVRRGGTRDMTG